MFLYIPLLVYIPIAILWCIGSIALSTKISWNLITSFTLFSLVGIGILYYIDNSPVQSKLLKSLLFLLVEGIVIYFVLSRFKLTF